MQSLVAERFQSQKVGYAFGLLSLSRCFGASVGALIGTNAEQSWRLVFMCVGLMSIFLGYLNLKMLRQSKRKSQLSLRHETLMVFKIPTIQVIMLQGVVGSMPWVALSFATLYLQQIGFTNNQSSTICTLFIVGSGIGGFLGGLIGDRMNRLFPNRGRIITAQVSVFGGLPFVYCIFQLLDQKPSSFIWFCLSFLGMGLVASWCSAGCNRPVFIDIVPQDLRATAFAWLLALDQLLDFLLNSMDTKKKAVQITYKL
ncbi:major facilitator superfamily domain-containing protein [Gorgonomyces haynaldii]|nr:major facilitator superfamily domain-containing protein [Gorgonomyces haynaldii]